MACRRAANPCSSASIRGSYSSFRAGRPANAGERETLRRETRRSRRMQSGCAWAQVEPELIPRRGVDHSPATTGPFGCKARQVRATHAGVGSRTVATPIRRRREPSPGIRSKKAEREQLNDERGVKPLPVSHGPRRSRIGNRLPLGWVRGRFCILAPEIGVPRRREAGNYGGAGASHMPGSPGRFRVLPT